MKKLAIVALATILSACSTLIPANKTTSGVFKGTLPCADCEKIEAELTLNKDSTYEYHTVYHKRGKEYPFTDKGKYSWDKERNNVVRLENSANLAVLISDTHAELCGPDGKPVEGKQDYRLPKVAQ